MWLHRTFHLNDGALDEMKREGLDPTLLDKLRPHRRESSFSASEFEALLAGVGRDELSRRDRQIIVRYTRLGWLRLERIVPNRTLREWIEALVFALVVAGIVRTFLFAPFKIPSGSMIPTIEIGDHIFATMYSYGIPVPFADLKLLPRPIRRGDIVIFPYPLDPSVDYIKRVVGLPGETVEVKGKQVVVDGRPIDEPYAYYDPAVMTLIAERGLSLPSFGPYQVPPGKIFVMGDNRLNSSDSRVWGFVDVPTVKGEGQIIYWSHDPAGGLLGGYRWGRLGSLLR